MNCSISGHSFYHFQIMYMGWGQERASPGRNWQAWKPKFIALKGTDIYLFDIPPVSCGRIGAAAG